MPTTLKSLEAAFAKIEQVTKDEVTFDVAGTPPITMRVMVPEEENAVQQFVSAALPDLEGEDTNRMQAILAYLDKFKLATIAQAIVAIGDTDLRDVQYVETGETLPNNVAVKITRAEAMRGIVAKWTRTVRDAVFKKYGELLLKVEIASEGIVKFDPVDLDAEIARLTERLDDLKKAKEQQTKKERGAFAAQVEAVSKIDAEQDAEAAKAVVDAMTGRTGEPEGPKPEEPQKAPPAAPQAPSSRQSIIPTTVTPPAPAPVAQPPEAPPAPAAQPSEAPIVIPPPAPQKPVVPPFEEIEDSFMGDDTADEVAAANRRLALARRARMPVPPAEGSMLTAAHQQARPPAPPHLGARAAAAALQRAEATQERELASQKAVLAGKTAEGVEVYRLPTQDLTDRGALPEPPAGAPPPRVALNPTGGSRNPRFNPPGK